MSGLEIELCAHGEPWWYPCGECTLEAELERVRAKGRLHRSMMRFLGLAFLATVLVAVVLASW